MRGSKYELKFDYQGKPVNEDEIRRVLKKGASDTSGQVLTGLGTAGPDGQNGNMQSNGNQGNTNMSHPMVKD